MKKTSCLAILLLFVSCKNQHIELTKQENEIVQISLYKKQMQFLADNCWGKSTFALALDPTMANMCQNLNSKLESYILIQYNKMKSFVRDCSNRNHKFIGLPGIDVNLETIDANILFFNKKLLSDFEKKCLPNFNKEEARWLLTSLGAVN